MEQISDEQTASFSKILHPLSPLTPLPPRCGCLPSRYSLASSCLFQASAGVTRVNKEEGKTGYFSKQILIVSFPLVLIVPGQTALLLGLIDSLADHEGWGWIRSRAHPLPDFDRFVCVQTQRVIAPLTLSLCCPQPWVLALITSPVLDAETARGGKRP